VAAEETNNIETLRWAISSAKLKLAWLFRVSSSRRHPQVPVPLHWCLSHSC
jgi:hypothetical protein